MLEGLTPPKNKSESCKVEQVLSKISEADQAILIEALDNQLLWPHATLSKAIRQRGLSLADVTIANHRRRTCACFRG
jgi:hypothetical protein